MQPEQSQLKTTSAAIPAFVHVAHAGAAPGTSPAADLQQLIWACYGADAAGARAIPVPGRLAIMFAMSAALWSAIALAVRLTVG